MKRYGMAALLNDGAIMVKIDADKGAIETAYSRLRSGYGARKLAYFDPKALTEVQATAEIKRIWRV
jgi:hypothetical protein